MLFKNILVNVKSVVGVTVGPGKLILSPPSVRHT